eukprot:Nitzschia sp. Nitz4//scaffold89_size161592//136355//138386//NITZ4_002398-RA/size161592-exonerate_est2genome-gene-0.153-mRNA-1//1//CDS//3329559676//3749//frame0
MSAEEGTNGTVLPNPTEAGPCGSGKDRCIQPWAKADPALACMRCRIPLHPLCAAIDATKSIEQQRHWPQPIRICYQCLLPGEEPNNCGLFKVPNPAAVVVPTEMVPEMQPPFANVEVQAPAPVPADSAPKQNDKGNKPSSTVQDTPPVVPAALPKTGTTKQAQESTDANWEILAKPHQKFAHLVAENKAVPPASSKKAVWWRVFHVWNMDLNGDDEDRHDAFCNVCGETVQLDPNNKSPWPLQKHLKATHLQLHDILLRIRDLEIKEAEKDASARPTPQRPAQRAPVQPATKSPEAPKEQPFDWVALSRPHASFLTLVTQNKVIPPPSTKHSVWWRVFHCWNMELFGEAVESQEAYCNLCGTIVRLDPANSTPTPLRQHLKGTHKPVFKEMLKLKEAEETPPVRPYAQNHAPPARHAPPSPSRRTSQRAPVEPPSPPQSNAQQSGTNRNTETRVPATGAHLKAITQWILETNQPLDVVESSSFSDMTAALMGGQQGGLELSKRDIGEYLSYLKTEMQKKFKSSFVDQKLVHVHDQWVDYNSRHYWTERIRWIDNDFKLQDRVIASDSGSSIFDGDLRLLLASLGINAKYQVPVTVSGTAESNDSHRMVVGDLVLPSLDITLNRFAMIALEVIGEKMKTCIEKARTLTHKIHN